VFYDQLISGDRPGCLLIVLLHGSGADATQWIDIGLVNAVDNLQLGSGVRRVVAVAPDLADHAQASSLVIDALLPHVDVRFGPGMLAIGGISRGAAGALEVARDPGVSMLSVGLHSPAIRLRQPVERASWSCFVDVGNDDSLAASATETAAALRHSGIAVSEHHWPGGHNRQYWRRHLPDYLAFHVATAKRSAA
jgi:predicted esterase